MRTKVLGINQRISIGVRSLVADLELRTLAKVLKSVGLTLEIEATTLRDGREAVRLFAARRPVTHDIRINGGETKETKPVQEDNA